MVIIHKRERERHFKICATHKSFWGIRKIIIYQKASIFAESIALVSVKLQILTLRLLPLIIKEND